MAFAQKSEMESLRKLGREPLIQMAIQKLNEPGFRPENYDRVIVKAGKEDLLVEFRLSILLKRKSSCFYHVVTVALAGSGSGMAITGDCNEPEFYAHSPDDQEKIKFVRDAINKSDDVGHVTDYQLPEDTDMEITEHPTYFYVEVSSWSTYSHFKVNKITGKISEAAHKHYDRSGEGKDDYEIIR